MIFNAVLKVYSYLMLFMRCFGNSCNFSARLGGCTIALHRVVALYGFDYWEFHIVFALCLLVVILFGDVPLWDGFCAEVWSRVVWWDFTWVGFFTMFDVVLIIIYTVMVSLDSRFL
eukprot:gene2676-1674_t